MDKQMMQTMYPGINWVVPMPDTNEGNLASFKEGKCGAMIVPGISTSIYALDAENCDFHIVGQPLVSSTAS